MPMMGNEKLSGAAGIVLRAAPAEFFGRCFCLDFVFMIMSATFRSSAESGGTPPQSAVTDQSCYAGCWMSSSRANCLTERADFSTSRCVLAISFLRSLVLLRACCFKESSRTLMPSKVWAISS